MNKLDTNMYIEIGSTLKKKRLEKKMSLDQLVHAINHTKTKSTIKRYEDGVTRIDYDTLVLICHALEIDPNDLIDSTKQTSSIIPTDEDMISLFANTFHINESLLMKLIKLDYISLVKVENYVQSMTDPINKNYTARMKDMLK